MIRLSVLFEILNLCDNEKFDKKDPSRAVVNVLNKRFSNFSFNGESKSINKSMIPFYGTYGSKQRINNKPIRVGYIIWILAET